MPKPSGTKPARRDETNASSPSPARIKPNGVSQDGELQRSFNVTQAEAEVAAHPDLFETHEVHIDQLLDNPFNPPGRGANPTELADILPSVIRDGVMSHMIVVDRDELVRNEPQLQSVLPSTGRWVIAAGKRRKEAAKLAAEVAGPTRLIVPIAVRNDWATARHLRRIILQENLHRKGLLPTEEAEQYRGLRDDENLNLDDIALLAGVSKGQVSKRLSLLDLPAVARDLVDSGRLSQDGALELRKLSGPDAQERVIRQAVDAAARQAKEAAGNQAAGRDTDDDAGKPPRLNIKPIIQAELLVEQRAAATEKARGCLAAAGVAEIDPDELFGEEAYRHRLRDDEVALAQQNGLVAGAVIDGGRPIYYRTEAAPLAPEVTAQQDAPGAQGQIDPDLTIPQSPTEPPAAPLANREFELRRQAHEDAATSRREACIRLIADLPSLRSARRNDLMDVLADGVLVLTARRPSKPDARFLKELVGPAKAATENNPQNRKEVQLTALATALAACEAAAAAPTSIDAPWEPAVRRYVQRLADLGYHATTDYEADKLT